MPGTPSESAQAAEVGERFEKLSEGVTTPSMDESFPAWTSEVNGSGIVLALKEALGSSSSNHALPYGLQAESLFGLGVGLGKPVKVGVGLQDCVCERHDWREERRPGDRSLQRSRLCARATGS